MTPILENTMNSLREHRRDFLQLGQQHRVVKRSWCSSFLSQLRKRKVESESKDVYLEKNCVSWSRYSKTRRNPYVQNEVVEAFRDMKRPRDERADGNALDS